VIGDIIDKYQIIRKIGEGGMATVYQGRHTSLHRDVAVKIIHPGLAHNERNRQRFAREAKAIEKLDHKNIVKIWDYSGTDFHEDEKPCYIITELVEGLNLAQLMQEYDEIPSEIIALIGIEVCEALSYAHSNGFIHRDIKPDNIMLRKDGAIKLLDFGIARFADEDSLTMTKSLVGSPAFMSPEQAKDEADGELDHRSDLFSLGIVLYQLSTGELPYHGSNPSVVLKNIIDNRRNQAHCVNPEMSIGLSDCIEGLLQTNRDLRLPDAHSVAHTLRQVWTEADLDITDPQWSLHYWLADPVSYKNRLDAHLKRVLLEKGRALMGKGKSLEAQRFLNRLLILDPENDEVFDLLQNMHTGVDIESPKTEVSTWMYAIPAVAIGALVWFFKPEPSQPVVSTQVIAPPVEKETIVELVEANDSTASTKALPNLERPKKRFSAPNLRTLTKRNPGKVNPTNVKVSEPENKAATQQTAVVTTAETKLTEPVKQGTLTVSIPNAWAEIWIDGKKYGRTGQVKPISLDEGNHEVKLINPYSVPHIETISISADQPTHIELRSLKRKPATLIFASTLSPECEVILDKDSAGELGVLKYRLSINTPNIPHDLQLDCPDNVLKKEIGQLTPGSSMPVRF